MKHFIKDITNGIFDNFGWVMLWLFLTQSLYVFSPLDGFFAWILVGLIVAMILTNIASIGDKDSDPPGMRL